MLTAANPFFPPSSPLFFTRALSLCFLFSFFFFFFSTLEISRCVGGVVYQKNQHYKVHIALLTLLVQDADGIRPTRASLAASLAFVSHGYLWRFCPLPPRGPLLFVFIP